MSASIRAGSLVLYKIHPALVGAVGDKIEIRLDGGKSRKVRPKDVRLLHPGPLDSLARLQSPPQGNLEEAWELLQGEQPAFDELAELVYGDFTPASAWATWQLLQDGLYFSGDPEAIHVNDPERVAELQAERARREAEAAAWQGFLERVEAGRLEPARFHALQEALPGRRLRLAARALGLQLGDPLRVVDVDRLRVAGEIEPVLQELPGGPGAGRGEVAIHQLRQLVEGGLLALQQLPGLLQVALRRRLQPRQAVQRPGVQQAHILGAYLARLAAVEPDLDLVAHRAHQRRMDLVEHQAAGADGCGHVEFPRDTANMGADDPL